MPKEEKKEIDKKEKLSEGESFGDKLEEEDLGMVVGGMSLEDRCTKSYTVGVCHLFSLDGMCHNLILDRYEPNGLFMLRLYYNCSKGYFSGATFDVGFSDEIVRKILRKLQQKF